MVKLNELDGKALLKSKTILGVVIALLPAIERGLADAGLVPAGLLGDDLGAIITAIGGIIAAVGRIQAKSKITRLF